MVSPATETTSSLLVVSLEETLQALAQLHATASRLRPMDGCAASGFPAFSLAELDRLRSVTRQGGAGVTRRLKELIGHHRPAGHLPELWREGVSRPDSDVAAPGVSAAQAVRDRCCRLIAPLVEPWELPFRKRVGQVTVRRR